MKTLDELWYGNISPFEQCTRGDKRLKELLKLVARNREELDGTLTDKQKETLEKFEDCMNEMHRYWYDFFYVEVMTGLRRGEICGLKWQDINFEENKLQVKRSVSVKKGGGVSIGETKTETDVRCIQMPPSVAELLKCKKRTAITEWVFPHFLHPE